MSKLWQPVETAPRDGTEILLYVPGGRFHPEYVRSALWLSDDSSSLGEWWHVNDNKFYHFLRGPDPTHWMPLPTPPNESNADEA